MVTGGTGFIGSHLVEHLVQRGQQVRMLVRATGGYGFKARFLCQMTRAGVELVYGDIRDRRAVREAMRGVDMVYHLAAIMRDWGPRRLFAEVNVQGTENVLWACVQEGVQRIVFTSSIAATGLENYPGLKDETFPLTTSRHPYCWSKAKAEKICHRYATEHNLHITIVRPVYVYGPREFNVGPYIVARLLKRGFRILPGDGRNYHHMVYVADLVRALELAAQEQAIGQIYLIGGPLTTAREVWAALAEAMGTGPIIYVPKTVGYVLAAVMEGTYRALGRQNPPLLTFFRLGVLTNNNAWDCRKVARELGFRPQVGIREGMRRAVEWWRENGYL